MATIPAGVKQPTDRQPKKDKDEVSPFFTFEFQGESYTFPVATEDVINTGFIRRNRKDPAEMTFAALELLASPEQLAVIDSMKAGEFAAFQAAFNAHQEAVMGVTLGE